MAIMLRVSGITNKQPSFGQKVSQCSNVTRVT